MMNLALIGKNLKEQKVLSQQQILSKILDHPVYKKLRRQSGFSARLLKVREKITIQLMMRKVIYLSKGSPKFL
jgi:hypothetical protein